jgi:trehalose 6-phosphate phosphatase
VSCVDALLEWEGIERKVKAADECLLLTDFDGTLAEIVPDPTDAAPSPEMKAVLEQLRHLPGMHIAVISGRALADVRSRVGIAAIYSGNHGLEIEGDGIRFVDENALAAAGTISRICAELAEPLARFPGAILEHKGLSASVHFRRVREQDQPGVESAVRTIAAKYSGEVKVAPGKKVLELRPRVRSNKGTAALRIMQSLGPKNLPICVGDDVTDEDLFRQFPEGITVRVGDCEGSAAKYCVRGVPEVTEMFRRICMVWTERQGALAGET